MKRLITPIALVTALLVAAGVAIAVSGPDEQVEYTSTWDASTASVGAHTVEATAYDEAGNVSTDHVHVWVWGTGTHPTFTTMGTPSRPDVYLDTSKNSSLLRGNLYKTDGTTKITTSVLYAMKYVEGGWHFAGSDDTSATSKAYYGPTAGNYQFRVYPDRTADYKFVYVGNSYWEHSESPTITVKAWREVK